MRAGSETGPRAALLPRASLIAAVLVGLVAGPAGAQEAGVPLMIQTVPALRGVELSLFGTPVETDGHGLAVATGTPGTHELSAPGAGASDSTRWEFSRWSDGISSPSRTVGVASFTFLEAGYDVYHRASLSLVEPGGETIPEAVDAITLVDDRGQRVILDDSRSVWMLAQRVVETPTGLAAEEVGYRVESIVAGGRDLVPPGAQEIRPVAGENLEIVARQSTTATSPFSTPRNEVTTRQPSRTVESPSEGVVWLLLVVSAGVVLLAYALRLSSVSERLPAWPNEPWSEGVRRAGERAREQVARAGSAAAERARPVVPVIGRAGRRLVVVVEHARGWDGARARGGFVALIGRAQGRMRATESLTDAEGQARELSEWTKRDERGLLDESRRRLAVVEDNERELKARVSELETLLERLTHRVGLEPREIQLAKIAVLMNAPAEQAINVLVAPLRNLESVLTQVVARKEEEAVRASQQEE